MKVKEELVEEFGDDDGGGDLEVRDKGGNSMGGIEETNAVKRRASSKIYVNDEQDAMRKVSSGSRTSSHKQEEHPALRKGSSVRRSVIIVEKPDDGYGISDDEELEQSEMSSVRENIYNSFDENEDGDSESLQLLSRGNGARGKEEQLEHDAIFLAEQSKDFRERDPSVFVLLDHLNVRPQKQATALQVIVQVLPYCGALHSYYPRIDHFVMRILHEASSDVLDSVKSWRDHVGNDLLLRACLSQSLALATFLVENIHLDPDVFRTGTHETPLHVATRNRMFRMTEMLLRLGAFHSPADHRERTPLHYAAAAGDATTIALLLLYGANPRRQDESGKTPIDYALMREDAEDCISLLHTHSHWVAYQDRRSGRTFYENSVTHESTFERPLNVNKDMATVVHEATKNFAAIAQAAGNRGMETGPRDDNQIESNLEKGNEDQTEAQASVQVDTEVMSGIQKLYSSGKETMRRLLLESSGKLRHAELMTRMKTWRDLAWREGIRKASQRRHIRSLQAVREYQDRVKRGEAKVMNDEEIATLRAELSAVVNDQKIKHEEMEALRARLQRECSAREKMAAALKEAQVQVEAAQAERSVAMKQSADAHQLATRLERLEQDLSVQAAENERLKMDVLTERELRRKTHNKHMDLLGAIRVFCRIRPLNQRELSILEQQKQPSPCVLPANQHIAGGDPDTCVIPSKSKEFRCDACLGAQSTQQQVFAEVEPLVQSCIDGFNVCIFAYGQTGSGKSFTMFGPPDGNLDLQGIAPRSVRSLFSLLQQPPNIHQNAKVTCYGVELYNNQLRDLLTENPAESSESLKVRKDRSGMVYIEGVNVESVNDADKALELMHMMQSKRVVSATKMNAESSRSHFIYCLLIEMASRELKATVKGRLTLVDLAGSEKVDQSGVTGQGLKEAVAINQSLTALGDVIQALTSKAKFIPYRNNLLTQLMQDSIGGNAKTLMFINVSPAVTAIPETINSLQYGTRVKQIRNQTSKNLETEEIKALRLQLQELQKKLEKRDSEK